MGWLRAGATAALLVLLAAGTARSETRLVSADNASGNPLVDAAVQIASGIEIAVAVAAPIVAAAVVIEVAGALIARAASPAFLQPVLAPLRSVLLLACAALMLDRMAQLLIATVSRGP